MRVILDVAGGSSAGQEIHLIPGQTARIGCTEWADFSFPNDPGMADIHFAIVCTHQECLVRSLNEQEATLLNGKAVGESELRDGDEITAGQTTFNVRMMGWAPSGDRREQDLTQQTDSPVEEAAPVEAEDTLSRTAAIVSEKLDMEDEASQLLTEDMTVGEFIDLLTEKELHADAVRVLASALPKREAVWWSCLSVRNVCGDGLSDPDTAALEAAQEWVADPSEEHRRAAEQAAQATTFEGPASWGLSGAVEVLPPPARPKCRQKIT